MNKYQWQLEVAVRLMSHYLEEQSDVASVNVASEGLPAVLLGNEFSSFPNNKMAD